MKGVDTSILLGLLHGDPTVRNLLRRLRGVELATTEANLLELAWLAGRNHAHARRRREALERLRRKMTILPIDGRAVERVSQQLAQGPSALSPLLLSMLGALESSGCDELFTREDPRDWGKWRVKISRITGYETKHAR